MAGLHVLFVATKPSYPPSDGGRLLMWNTLQELTRRGHRITYLAPDLGDGSGVRPGATLPGLRTRLIPSRPRRLAPSLVRSLISGHPLSVIRHSNPRLRRAIAEELVSGAYDVVHAEQVQSFCNVPRVPSMPPVVLRAQNVESHLWRMVAGIRPHLAWVARFEASKMGALERRCAGSAAATIALTARDAAGLGNGLPAAQRRLHVIPPPFAASMPGGESRPEGEPPLLLLGGGWLPNRDSIQWFVGHLWDRVRSLNPGACAHVYGGRPLRDPRGVLWLPSPPSSRDLFSPHAVLAVPLRVASGIRMKIMEAWARGTPVVATPEAAEGLGAQHGVELLLARDGDEFGSAVSTIHRDSQLRESMLLAGRDRLRRFHDPVEIGDRIEEVYRQTVAGPRAPVGRGRGA